MKSNKKEPPVWLTSDINTTGLTIDVLNYIKGVSKRLPEMLSLVEFLLVYIIMGNVFEKTNFFKIWMRPYIRMNKKDDPDGRMKALVELGIYKSEAQRLFMKYLPIKYALQLVEQPYDCYSLFTERINTKVDKQLIFKRLRDFCAEQELSKDMLFYYRKIASPYKEEVAFVEALLSIHFLQHPEDLRFVEKEYVVSDVQIRMLCKKLEAGKLKSFDHQDILKLYSNSLWSPIVLKAFVCILQKESNLNGSFLFKRAIERMNKDAERGCSIKLRNESFFPIISIAITSSPEVAQNEGWTSIIPYLPEYDLNNLSHSYLVARAFEYFEKKPYGFRPEDFLAWYSYTKNDSGWLDLYLRRIKDEPFECFKKAVMVFEKIKDPRIIEVVIADCLPNDRSEIGDPLLLLNYLQKNDLGLYEVAKFRMQETGKLQALWTHEFMNYHRDTELYLKLAAHFS